MDFLGVHSLTLLIPFCDVDARFDSLNPLIKGGESCRYNTNWYQQLHKHLSPPELAT
jgi:hypothetical protein